MDEPAGEFLDTEWYREWPDPPTPEPEPHELDPWRSRRGTILLINRNVLERLVQPERMRHIERYDVERIEAIAESIAGQGLLEELLVLIDNHGKIALKDGHHRIVATRRWAHFEQLPFRLQEVDEELKVPRCARTRPLLMELIVRSATTS